MKMCQLLRLFQFAVIALARVNVFPCIAADVPADLTRARITAHLQEGANTTDWMSMDSEFERMEREIREHGDVTFSVLEDLLRNPPSPRFAAQAAGTIAVLNNIDRSEKIRVAQSVLSGDVGGPDPRGDVKSMVLSMVPAWGDMQDISWILPYVFHDNEATRLAAVKAIGEIGDRQSAEPLMRALRDRETRLTPQERVGDDLMQFGQKAVARIEERMAAREKAAATAPPAAAIGSPQAAGAPQAKASAAPSPSPAVATEKPTPTSAGESAGRWPVGTWVGGGVAIALLAALLAFLRKR